MDLNTLLLLSALEKLDDGQFKKDVVSATDFFKRLCNNIAKDINSNDNSTINKENLQ